MRSVTDIQADINSTESRIQQGSADQSQIDLWNMQVADLRKELIPAQEAAASLQDSIQTNGYWLDTVTIADVPVSECGMDEQSYNILREKVEADRVGITDSLAKQLADQQTANQAEVKRLNDLNSQLQEAGIKAYQEGIQLKADNESISTSRDNAARLLDEANAQIAQLNSHIADLQAQIAVGVRGAIQVESSDEQIKAQELALKASRIKVLSMVKNPEDITARLWDIVLASNGELVTINFLEKGKYTVISAEEAAQAQADIEASKNIPELTQISEEPAAVSTPQTDVQASTAGLDSNGALPQDLGEAQENVDQPDSNTSIREADLNRKPVTRAEHDALVARVTAVEAQLSGQVAA